MDFTNVWQLPGLIQPPGLEYQQLSRSFHTFCRASVKVPGSKSDAEEEGESAGSMAGEMWRYHNI